MFKGIKLKSKLPEKDDKPQFEDPMSYLKNSQPKKWMKTERNVETGGDQIITDKGEYIPKQKIEPITPAGPTDQELLELCHDIWDKYITGNVDVVDKLTNVLKDKQTKYLSSFLNDLKTIELSNKKQAMINEEEEEADDPIRQYDPTKSRSILQDIRRDQAMKDPQAEKQIYDIYKKKPGKFDLDNLYDEEYDEISKKGKKKGANDDTNKDNADDADKEDSKKKHLNKRDKKIEEKQKRKEILTNKRLDKVLTSCRLCLANNFFMEEQILSYANNTLLILSDYKRYPSGHFQIIPIEHRKSIVDLDEDTYDEVRNYMKSLVKMYENVDYGVVFIEIATDSGNTHHCIIDCIATPKMIDESLPLYFKKALEELESEWSTHKKIIEIKKEKGGIRKQIPKNFPYFYIDFGTQYGYAHIIERKDKFNFLFAHEIICSLLDIEKTDIFYPKKRTRSELDMLKKSFEAKWKSYDWTQMLK